MLSAQALREFAEVAELYAQPANSPSEVFVLSG
jgi:hypothetical protein